MSFLLHSYFGKSLATLYAKNRIKETTLKRRTNREEGSLVFPCSKGWSFGEFLLISHFMIIRVQKVWRTSEKGVILVVPYLLKLRFEIQHLPFLRSLQNVTKKNKEEVFPHHWTFKFIAIDFQYFLVKVIERTTILLEVKQSKSIRMKRALFSMAMSSSFYVLAKFTVISLALFILSWQSERSQMLTYKFQVIFLLCLS